MTPTGPTRLPSSRSTGTGGNQHHAFSGNLYIGGERIAALEGGGYDRPGHNVVFGPTSKEGGLVAILAGTSKLQANVLLGQSDVGRGKREYGRRSLPSLRKTAILMVAEPAT